MKKYEFTGETKQICISGKDITVRRIIATADFGAVRTGDFGGWIEKEANLSQEGEAWVYDDAKVCAEACVFDEAWVCGNAEVYGNAWVYGNAKVRDNTKVYGNTWVRGNAEVLGNAKVYGNAWVYDNAKVFGNAKVCAEAWVYGNAWVCGNAEVLQTSHILVIGPAGSRNDFTTFFKDKDNEISVKCGCFFGKIEEFLEKVKNTHGDNKHANVYMAAAEVAKKQIMQ